MILRRHCRTKPASHLKTRKMSCSGDVRDTPLTSSHLICGENTCLMLMHNLSRSKGWEDVISRVLCCSVAYSARRRAGPKRWVLDWWLLVGELSYFRRYEYGGGCIALQEQEAVRLGKYNIVNSEQDMYLFDVKDTRVGDSQTRMRIASRWSRGMK